jgi:hypothetical protein
MPENLLNICTRALDRISSIQTPTFIVDNPDPVAKMLLAIAKDVGEELTRDCNWQEVCEDATVTTEAAVDLYALPDDFERMAFDTMWETDSRRHMYGAASDRAWHAVKASGDVAGDRYRWRLHKNKIQVYPTPTAVFDFSYGYLSRYYCTNADGIPIEKWTADTDLPRMRHDLFIAGVRYYFKKEKGLPYSDSDAEYEAVIGSREAGNVSPGMVNASDAVCYPDGRYDRGRELNIPDYWVE